MQQGSGQLPGGPGAAPQDYERDQRPPEPEVPQEFNADPIMSMDDEAALIKMVQSSSSALFEKAIACKRLSMIGTRDAIPALVTLLSDERLGSYARFALEPMPDPAVNEALRETLGRLKGRLLVGVIHSLGVRKDAEAVAALGKLMYDSDTEVAQAASATLGTIGGSEAATLLLDGLRRTQVPVRQVVARASLVCAESLPEQNRAQAMEIYSVLKDESIPPSVRRAAFRATSIAP